jgi:NAD-dependent dihydropyrimidine dehydrogenase PreA subunit
VIIDPEKAKGRKEIVSSCPYGAVWWNEEKRLPQKCTFCAHLLDQGWKQTRCVQACPTGAVSIVYLTDEELERLVEKDGLEKYGGEKKGAVPRCFYKNLHRYNRAFIAGTVATGNDQQSDCVEDATIRLLKDGHLLDEQKSDSFGDFRFDGLEADGTVYSVEVVPLAGEKKRVEIKLEKSCFTGTVWI